MGGKEKVVVRAGVMGHRCEDETEEEEVRFGHV